MNRFCQRPGFFYAATFDLIFAPLVLFFASFSPDRAGHRRFIKCSLFVVFLSCSGLHGQGQAQGKNTIGLPQIINYSKTDFHGGTQTWDIKQDRNGMMYFANNEGLLSFDGTYWKINPLPNRTILRSIAIDNDRIYAGGQGEMGFFAPDANGFLRYESLTRLLPKSQSTFADIWDIRVVGSSVFFRATDRIFELKNNNIQVFLPKSEWQFMSVAGDELLAQDKKNGLFAYKNGQWIALHSDKALSNELISGLIPTGNGPMLISTIKRRFFLLQHDSIAPASNYTSLEPKNSAIYKIERLNNREFVAGTTSEGCLVLDFNGRIIQQISREEGLQNNNVLCVFLDRDRNLWAGLNNGISLIAYNAAIKYIRPNKTNEVAGFSAKIFRQNLYIGSSDGAYMVPLAREDKDLSFSLGSFSLIRNSSGQVWNLDEVNQQLLMGHQSGTFVIGSNNEAVSISPEASWLFIPVNPVPPSPNILAGTYTGLKMLGFSNNTFSDLGDLGGVYESLRYLAIDNNGSIWASHPYRGIYKLDLSADQKKYTAQLFTEKDGLPSTLNNQVFRIRNRIVFATERGPYEFDARSGKFVHSSFLYPAFGNMELRYLNEDAEGNIWFCSGKRIGVLHNGPNFSITFFPELTGQILSGFENIYPYNDENIFVGSEKGMIHLNFKKYIETKISLSVLLSSVKITGNQDSTIAGGYSANTVLHFPKHFNSFHFEYSSPVFGLQENIEYSYMLDGYDAKWGAWSSKHEKDYTNLSDGQYTFMVKAHDNLGNESGVISYVFIIGPPFYKTGWAYICYVLLFFWLLYLLNKWQQRSLYRQKIKYEEKQEQIIARHQLEIEKNEKEIIKLQNEKLANEVFLQKRELADASMHLIEREDALVKVREELQKLYKKTGNSHDVRAALKLVSDIETNKSNWDQFASHFDEINNDFLKKLKSGFAQLNSSDLKVCAYLQLNLSSKEIAQLMNISIRGVETIRYRLRKKLEIQNEQSLNDFLNKI